MLKLIDTLLSLAEGLLRRLKAMSRRILILLLPFWAKASDYQAWGPRLRWFVRILILTVFFIGFTWLQYYLTEVRPIISEPAWLRGWVVLKRFWLALLVDLVFLFLWIGWWVWKLWTEEVEESPFPDIDAAWAEAVHALERAGIRISEAPLFLVLGRPATGEPNLFRASKVEWKIDVPEKEEAPIHVYANRDAIFVSCAGASLLGEYAALLAAAKETTSDLPEAGGGNSRIDQSASNVMATLGPEGRAQLIGEILAEAERAQRPLNDGEDQLLKYLGYAPEAAPASAAAKGAAASLFRDAQAIERLTARLQHLCRLIVRDRRPYCPANGLLLLVPFGGTEEKKATETATFCQRDVAAVREVFQMYFPCVALVTDMEKAVGFGEFTKRFPAGARDKRLGQSFPWVPDVDPAKLPQTLENGIGWVCHSLLAFWIFKFFQLENSGDKFTEVVRRNAEIFELMAQMGLRHKDLSRIVLQALAPERTPLLLFGGCYLAGTGRKTQEQAFLHGVFEKMIKGKKGEVPMQNLVYWTEQALQEDRAYHRRATLGWWSVALLSLLTVGLATLSFYKQWW
jgi:hypothetical protein